MSYRVAVVGDLETVVGFLLAGVAYYHVHRERQETMKKIEELLRNQEIGLILLTARVKEELGEGLANLLKSAQRPIVVTIPDRLGYYPLELDEVERIVKRTTGVEVVIGR